VSRPGRGRPYLPPRRQRRKRGCRGGVNGRPCRAAFCGRPAGIATAAGRIYHPPLQGSRKGAAMVSITLICVGKCKEKFYLDAAAEYEKRLKGYAQFKLIELPECRLPDDPSPAEIAQGLSREAEAIRKAIPKGAWLCVLTPEGKMLSSPGFAKLLAGVKTAGRSSLCFLI